MTTIELRKIENYLIFHVNPLLYGKEQLQTIDMVLEVARNLQELNISMRM